MSKRIPGLLEAIAKTNNKTVTASTKISKTQEIVDRVNRITRKKFEFSSQLGGISLELNGRQLTPRAPLKQFDKYVSVFLAGFESAK